MTIPDARIPIGTLADRWRAELARGLERQLAGDLDGAARCYEQVLEALPEEPDALHLLGLVRLRLGEPASAVDLASRSLEISAVSRGAWLTLAEALEATGDGEDAIDAYLRAYREDPNAFTFHDVERFVQFGCARMDARDLAGATECAAVAVELAPESHGAIALDAWTSEIEGDVDRAEERFRDAIEIDASYAAAWLGLARLGRLAWPSEVERVEELAAEPYLGPRERAALYFALGAACDRAAEIDRAFRHFATANRAVDAHFEPDKYALLLRRVADVFTPEFLASCAGWGDPTERPVFVVGMPRSGTTLVERILAAHPAVSTSGESPALGEIAKELHVLTGAESLYPDAARALDPETVVGLARRYLAEIGPTPDGVHRTVDKMPGNLVHVGLARLLFPNARVIQCRRDVRDTCLSNYFTYYSDGRCPWSYDLDHLARYAKACTTTLDRWADTWPGAVIDVSYEELVDAPEAGARRLVEFLGLEWDPACLESHRSGGAVFTASSNQVREPVHTRSCGRWRAYARYLGRLFEGLEVSAPL